MALTSIEVPYRLTYDFGIGVDLASGSPMGKVVKTEGAISSVEFAGGANVLWRLMRIHTTAELESKLGIEASANYGSGLFGPSVSARFNFAKDRKIQNDSLFMAAYATVTLKNLSIDDPTLTDVASGIANLPDVFATRYGNMFVRGMTRGGIFLGTIQIDTSSAETSDSIAGELSGSYGLFSAEAKAKLDELHRQHRSEIFIDVYHEGGPIDLTLRDPQNPVELYELLQKWLSAFQSAPEQNAVAYYVQLAPIAIANGPLPPNPAQIQHAQDVLVLCARQRSAILDGLNLMDYIIQHPTRYDFPAPTTLAHIVEVFDGYQADLDLVGDAASQAMNDVTQAKTPADYASEHGKRYPQGVPPAPMPTLKPGAVNPSNPVSVFDDFLGAWQNTNEPTAPRSTHISVINTVPADDTHANVRVRYADPDFGESALLAEWDAGNRLLKGATTVAGPRDTSGRRLAFESKLEIGNPDPVAHTLVVNHTWGPQQIGSHAGFFRPSPNPTHTDVFRRIGL
jgi:hypothetical protein